MDKPLALEQPSRRTFLKQVAGTAMAAYLPPLSDDRDGMGTEAMVLEDHKLRCTFDPISGALNGLMWKPANWAVHGRPELGMSFRMHVPLPDRRDNFILGQKQRVSRIERLASGNQIRLEWKDLVSENGGVLPIGLIATVSLEGGALTFATSLTNVSPLVVESVEYPYVADLRASRDGDPLWRQQVWYDDLQSQELHPHFTNAIWGYWGFESPLQRGASSSSLFCLIQSVRQGVYVEVHEPKPAYLVEYTFEQKPGVQESIHDRTPEREVIGGIPARLEFRTTHFLFAPPKSTTALVPIVLRPYDGDWQSGVDLYKQWRKSWFRQVHVPGWVNDVHAWQQLQMNSPEDDLRFRYRDLVKIGEECARNGVAAIQLVGWNRGGQDRGNPCLDTDPRLGTSQELRDAIAKVQAMGVKVVLFAKFVWADKSTEWYRQELYKYAARDPYGEPYENPGYGYRTPTNLAGINSRRFAVMCPQCERYREIAVTEFQKILALGAAGMLYDEVCHHGPVKYCFAADHGHPVPAYVYAGDILLAEAFQEVTRLNPEFLFAGEAPEDIVRQYYPMSYFRISGWSKAPVSRYIDSQAPLMVAVTGFDDRETLNRILMYRYVISYEPYDFKGRLSDFPLTLEYGKKIDSLRRRYRGWLWDAQYYDRIGAKVVADGQPYSMYSVFRNPAGKRAVVIVNEHLTKTMNASVELEGTSTLMIATPEQPDAKPTGKVLAVPARSAAVLMEQ